VVFRRDYDNNQQQDLAIFIVWKSAAAVLRPSIASALHFAHPSKHFCVRFFELKPNSFSKRTNITIHQSAAAAKVTLSLCCVQSERKAFYNATFSRSGAADEVLKHGDWFSHSKTNRALIFARDQSKVTDLESMMQLMRYNDFESDPLGKVAGCQPVRTPAASIASRLDLSDPNGTCNFTDHMVGHSGYGALDAKVASKESFPSLEFMAVAGPTHGDRHAPFRWSHTNLPNIPAFKPIDEFNFQPIVHKWESNSGHTNLVVPPRSLVTVLLLSSQLFL